MTPTAILENLPVRQKNQPCCQDMAPASMTRVETEKLAEKLKALADPTRLGMLDLLAQQSQPLCVCDMTAVFRQNQPTISHHLRLLRQSGLIDSERRGIWSYYWATDGGRRTLESVKSWR